MGKSKIFQVDAFTTSLFRGNPAAVCPLDTWLEDGLMQEIAAENNLAETAFFVPENDGFFIRWFTPRTEVDLCGHATLAAAHVLYNHLGFTKPEIAFNSRSGILKVAKADGLLVLDFPANDYHSAAISELLTKGLREKPTSVFRGMYYMAIFESEDIISNLHPDYRTLSLLDKPVIATAPGVVCDFVSRFFAPSFGIDEDPVTGSAHCMLVPYWSKVLEKNTLHAFQNSERSGEIFCEHKGDRVFLKGSAITYLQGEIQH